MPAHLRPSAPTASRALLCGDPARALAIAQRVMGQPRMSNHHRGLWGYFGETESGTELTVQATGIGGPSAAIVVEELAELGMRAAIRIGTCAAPGPSPPPGSGVLAGTAIALDGTSAALGAPPGGRVEPDPGLLDGLSVALPGDPVKVVSRDLPLARLPEPPGVTGEAWVGDLQSAPLLLACRSRGIAAAALLVVGASAGRRLDDEPLEAALIGLSRIGVRALEGLDLS